MDATYMELTIRLTLALLLGGAIGIEREYRAKEAGFRTHFLVALGSALFCLVSQFGFGVDLKDSSRVAAQVVSGIGFLGAGTIIFQKNVVRGLTTAAGLWVTAAIGLACGTGMYLAAVLTTAMVLLGLEVLNYWIPQLGLSTIELSFSAPSRESVKEFITRIKQDGMEVHSYELKERRLSKEEFLEASSILISGSSSQSLIIRHLHRTTISLGQDLVHLPLVLTIVGGIVDERMV